MRVTKEKAAENRERILRLHHGSFASAAYLGQVSMHWQTPPE